MVTILDSTLPQIRVSAKQSEWRAHVNAFVTDAFTTDMANGSWKRGLWYLSYVLPRGQGAIGQAIAHTFFTSNSQGKSFYLETVGGVALGSYRQDLQNLGYKIHWNYRMEPLGPDAIQCIIEPLMLTCFDPQLAEAGTTARRSQKKGTTGKGKREILAHTLSTVPQATALADEGSELVRRELKPLFLLLVPGSKRNDQNYLEQLHLAYLRRRCPFDLQEEWASFLWQRACSHGEVRDLNAWSYTYSPQAKPEDFALLPPAEEDQTPKEEAEPAYNEEESPFQAVIAKAYLCLPSIEGIHQSLVQMLNPVEDEQQREEEEAVA